MGSFDLTLVRREVEHVLLRPMALTLPSIYFEKVLRCAYSLITVSYQEDKPFGARAIARPHTLPEFSFNLI